MKITKLGHCCLLIEQKGVRILTDPGTWNDYPEEHIANIDAIIITHEHSDHLHIDAVKSLIAINPTIGIYTNEAVGKVLKGAGIDYTELINTGEIQIKGLKVTYFQTSHADVYSTIIPVLNTPFLIDDVLFYPGDSLFKIDQHIKALALPVSGPWLKLADAIDYAKALKPEIAFPVHDGMLKHLGSTHVLPEKVLNAEGISFKPMLAGDSIVID